MQEKMECDWFKPSKHEVIQHSTSKFATKLKFKINKPKQKVGTLENKMREMHNGMKARNPP